MQRIGLYILEILFIIFIALLCGILIIWAPAPWLRVPSGVILALFLPGYLLLELIYPANSGDTYLWKLGLILPVNIALTGVILLFLNYSSDYTLDRAIVFQIILVTLFAVAILIRGIRRKEASTVEILFDDVYAKVVIRKHNFVLKPARSVLLLSVLFLIGAVIFAIATPRQSLPMTEFYVLSTDSKLIGSIPEDQGFKYGIYNHEGAPSDYRVEITAVAQAGDEIVSSETIHVNNDEKIEKHVTLPALPSGVQRIEMRLFMNNSTLPHRFLSIPVSQ
jgi:uncharacterized membrane protein